MNPEQIISAQASLITLLETKASKDRASAEELASGVRQLLSQAMSRRPDLSPAGSGAPDPAGGSMGGISGVPQ